MSVDPPTARRHPQVPRRSWVRTDIMGMPISLLLRGPHLRPASAVVSDAVAMVFEQLAQLEHLLSIWLPASQVSHIRDGALDINDADPVVQQVARYCRQAKQATDGYFDDYLPDSSGQIRWNPTGLVKGWAVQQVVAQLAVQLPEHDLMVNAGGDVMVHCNRSDTPDWQLGIENPRDHGDIVATFALRTGGIATSGTASRGAHIHNPHTGQPATELASVSVIGPSLMWADVYATAAFARGRTCHTWLAGLPDYTWALVDADGRLITPGSTAGSPETSGAADS